MHNIRGSFRGLISTTESLYAINSRSLYVRSALNDQANHDAVPNAARWTWQFVVAVVLLAGFVGLIVAMMFLARGDETVWQRRVYVFGGAEAIVFTIIGWLFGREVNRMTAESAKGDAIQARQEAADARHQAVRSAGEAAEAKKSAAEETIKGRAVRALVRNGLSTTLTQERRPRDIGLAGTDGTDGASVTAAGVLSDLGALVNELYGERP